MKETELSVQNRDDPGAAARFQEMAAALVAGTPSVFRNAKLILIQIRNIEPTGKQRIVRSVRNGRSLGRRGWWYGPKRHL